MSWWHSHVHSEWSSLDGMVEVGDLVRKAADLGQPALGLTDHGNMLGWVDLYKACRRAGIQPWPGVELYLVEDEEHREARYHVTVLARTTRGLQGLVRLVSTTNEAGRYYRKPLAHLDDIAAFAQEYGSELVVTTGCFFGPVQQALYLSDENRARRWLTQLAGWFPDAYIEIQHHDTDHGGMTDDEMVTALWGLSQFTGIRPLVTQDCHYLNRGHAVLHGTMKSVAYGEAESEVSFPGDSYHLSTEAWVEAHLAQHPGVWEAGRDVCAELVERHAIEVPQLDRYRYRIPRTLTEGQDPVEVLERQCRAKLGQRVEVPEYRQRLDDELEVIEQTGFAAYFLLVAEVVSWSRAHGIMVQARGSAGGSLICWALGITTVDPIRHGLDFDRFLTLDRERPPDIDLDVEDTGREQIIEWLRARFRVLPIGTVHRLGYDPATDTGSIMRRWQTSVRGDERYDGVRTLAELRAVDPVLAAKLWELDEHPIRTMPSTHAGGLALDDPEQPLGDWVPTMRVGGQKGHLVTGLLMDQIEDLGYLKLDLLGLRTLGMAHEILDLLGRDPTAGLGWIPEDDKATYKLIRQGRRSSGIFQLEGGAAREGCRKLKPRTLDDLALVNALYRPSARNSGITETFLARRNGDEPVPELHPVLKPLAETLGVTVYQEQVLAVFKALGFTATELNRILKAIKVKHGIAGYNPESTRAFTESRARFTEVAEAAGMTPEEQESTWDLLRAFHGYGFNRAHAYAYALLGYQMAYLKAHHSAEFHVALLNSVLGDAEKLAAYTVEAARKANGLVLKRADVNLSAARWTIESPGVLRQGLAAIKGIGRAAAEHLAELAPFTDLDDMVARITPRVVSGGRAWTKDREWIGTLAVLKEAGALKSLGY